MSGDFGYTWEKLRAAVDTLASGTGPLQQRLKDAYISGLILLKPDDLPEPARMDLELVHFEMTADPRSDTEGSVASTAGTMSNETAQRVALAILRVYEEVSRRHPRG